MTEEKKRLEEDIKQNISWKKRGPYFLNNCMIDIKKSMYQTISDDDND